jgi:hypothetical protein
VSSADVLAIRHATDCPMTTRVYPVEVDDLWPDGLACIECGEAFQLGEFYTTIENVSAEFPFVSVAEVYAVVCLGCAAGVEVLGD